ncbi:hypothetical protein HS088_TW09G00872 [Tripterygium wilfordii]|uniref:Aminotransferase-like plant mobile domain-containing protein n=1 Tax=Tripterygium wilfordii TaxID=458696 RepID=A0A7J7D903_TRIWF|nr:hypothetical protein HS088_TW09G00872 [Tripterygium wilfordii]
MKSYRVWQIFLRGADYRIAKMVKSYKKTLALGHGLGSKETDKIIKKTLAKRTRKVADYKPQYRSNLQSVIREIESLSFRKAHLTELKKTPFWYLIHSIINNKLDKHKCRKSDDAIIDLIFFFDAKSRTFYINKKKLNITSDDIRLIFGIRDGGNIIDFGKRTKKIPTEFVRRRFEKCDRLTKVIISDALKLAIQGRQQNDIEDVARLLTLHILVSLFVPNKAQSLGWTYIEYVEDITNVTTYDWSMHILECLYMSLCANANNPTDVTGCVMSLPVSGGDIKITKFEKDLMKTNPEEERDSGDEETVSKEESKLGGGKEEQGGEKEGEEESAQEDNELMKISGENRREYEDIRGGEIEEIGEERGVNQDSGLIKLYEVAQHVENTEEKQNEAQSKIQELEKELKALKAREIDLEKQLAESMSNLEKKDKEHQDALMKLASL